MRCRRGSWQGWASPAVRKAAFTAAARRDEQRARTRAQRGREERAVGELAQRDGSRRREGRRQVSGGSGGFVTAGRRDKAAAADSYGEEKQSHEDEPVL
jgi:hypothetical protein